MSKVIPERLAQSGNEHSHQVALFAALAELALEIPEAKYIFAVPNGFHATAGQKGKMKAEGLRAGVWDVCVPFPRVGKLKHRYTGLWVEMKVGKNVLSDAQKDFGYAMFMAGWDTAVFYNWESAFERIKGYLCLQNPVTTVLMSV